MWNIHELEATNNSKTFRVLEEDSEITNQQFLELLATSADFKTFYNQHLSDSPFKAFFWENRPMIQQNLQGAYECTLVNSDFLAKVDPDAQTFNSYFKADREVVTFPNLGGDAKLIAPCPVSNHSAYAQIGDFVREAPESQIQEFWKMAGEEMISEIGDEPKWLSTSGLGVFWLHARIDTRPKYYQTDAYKTL